MNKLEQPYLDLLSTIMKTGTRQKNRTGIDTFMLPGGMMQFDLTQGFPAVTTKQLFFNAVKGELIGFLRGYTSAKQFRDLGCKIWDQNANENKAWLANPARRGEDDLGYIYSRLWTDMPHYDQFDEDNERYGFSPGFNWNQITKLLDEIKVNPESRRLIVNAWHPEVFSEAALPPCHVMFQVIIEQETKKMHMTMYQRSCDFFLGVPFNIASYALLLEMIANWTGYKAGTFTWFGADCHIYENHLDQVIDQLSRTPLPPPHLILDMDHAVSKGQISLILPEDISLDGYTHLGPIKAPMAV